MQILSISPLRYDDYSSLLKQMHKLRAAVFGDRLEWDVTITDAGERDQYDDSNPTYILAITSENKVVGCSRLLPASGITMLERTFPQLLANRSLGASETTVESSRFCVDTSLRTGRGGGQLHFITLAMFAGIIEWSIENGYGEIVTATDLRFERILHRAGWPMRRLGEPVEIGNTVAVAGRLPADAKSLAAVSPPGYRSIVSDISALSIRTAA